MHVKGTNGYHFRQSRLPASQSVGTFAKHSIATHFRTPCEIYANGAAQYNAIPNWGMQSPNLTTKSVWFLPSHHSGISLKYLSQI